MTLALLITAVGGAWAQETPLLTIESRDYESFYSGSKTFDDKVTVTFSNEVYNAGDEWGWYTIMDNPSLLTVAGINGYTITSCKFYTNAGTAADGYTVEGESPSVYLSSMQVYTDDSKSVSIGTYGVTKIEVYGAAASSEPAVEVTTNAASEGATFTEASFQMPAYDATAEYELVRDMSISMTTQVGDGNDGYRIRLKKSEQTPGKYVPAETDVAGMMAKIKVHDAIENYDLTFGVQDANCIVSIYAIDDNDQAFGDPIAFPNLVPGRYIAKAVAATGSAYDGETALSNIFVLFEGYEVEIAAGEYATFYKEENLYVEDTDAELYTITSVGSETATAAPLTVAKAYTPILVKNKGAEKKVILLIPTETEGDDVTAAPEFIGTLEATTIAASSENQTNYALNGKQFVWVKNAVEIGANKAWLSINTGEPSARITIVFEDATKIANTNITNITNGDWYDLNGRKLNGMPTKKGIYMNNGRKVVVK